MTTMVPYKVSKHGLQQLFCILFFFCRSKMILLLVGKNNHAEVFFFFKDDAGRGVIRHTRHQIKVYRSGDTKNNCQSGRLSVHHVVVVTKNVCGLGQTSCKSHFCIEEGCLHQCPFSATVVVVPLWVTLTVHA